MLRCEARVFPVGRLQDKSAIFYSAENAHASEYESGHMASGHFVLGRDKFDYWPLAVSTSMPPTKVCPQFKAAVPVRRKTCERCDLVFRFKRKAECNLHARDETYGSSRIR